MPDIRIESLETEDRLDELVALNERIHDLPDGFCRKVFKLNPASNKPAYHRFLLEKDELVSGTSLLRHKLGWYGSTIDAGEIGLVGTYEKHRGKGYASKLMESWFDTIREEGITMSFLWGIPDFYERYHYHYAIPNHSTLYVSLPRSCTVEWESTEAIRSATRDDRELIKKLYRAYNTDLNCCLVRSDEQWAHYFNLTDADDNARWWILGGPLGGYALVAGNPPKVWEIAATSPSSLKALLLGLFKEYPSMENLDLYHHPEMPAGKWAYHWGARISSPEDIWKGTWGGMVRVMDPVALLKGMAGEFNRRLQESRFYKYSGAIAFESEVGSAAIKITDGEVEAHECEGKASLKIPARVLTPMMSGYQGFERYREELRDIPDSVAEIMRVLFPRYPVFIYALLYSDEGFDQTH